jgi:hypothetical protein
MTTLVLKYIPINKIQQKSSYITLPKISWKVFAVMFLFILCLSVYYVFQINNLTGGKYLISDYQKEINTSLAEKGILETKFARTGFLDNIEQRTQLLNFEKTAEIKYVQILENPLAKAK